LVAGDLKIGEPYGIPYDTLDLMDDNNSSDEKNQVLIMKNQTIIKKN